MDWFQDVDTKDITLPSGGEITVKMGLTKGETDRLTARTVKPKRMVSQNGHSDESVPEVTGENPTATIEYVVDLESFDVERILAWLTEWDARDKSGKPVPLTRATVKSLRPAIAKEITDALSAHIEELEGPLPTATASE